MYYLMLTHNFNSSSFILLVDTEHRALACPGPIIIYAMQHCLFFCLVSITNLVAYHLFIGERYIQTAALICNVKQQLAKEEADRINSILDLVFSFATIGTAVVAVILVSGVGAAAVAATILGAAIGIFSIIL